MTNMGEIKEKLIIYNYFLNIIINNLNFKNERLMELIEEIYSEVKECNVLIEKSDKSIYELAKKDFNDMINKKVNYVDTLISEFYITYMKIVLKNINDVYLLLLASKENSSLDELEDLINTVNIFIIEFDSYKIAIKNDMLSQYELIISKLTNLSSDINDFIVNINNVHSLK